MAWVLRYFGSWGLGIRVFWGGRWLGLSVMIRCGGGLLLLREAGLRWSVGSWVGNNRVGGEGVVNHL